MNNHKYKNYFQLHFIVLLLGFTAILGKLISIPAVELVWYRTLIAAFSLFVYLKFKRISLKVPTKELLKIMGIGLIVAAHWICFFNAIKVSNVSVTLGCLASGTLFTSFLEPLSQKRRIFWVEVVLGIIIIIGLYLIFQFETNYTLGIIFALIAAFLSSLFTVLNKNISNKFNANVVSFYEMLAGFIGICMYMIFTQSFSNYNLKVNTVDIICLVILAVVCTSYAFAATVELMKEISAFIVVLSINLEPVYGILLAFFIFGESEHMTTGFYFGTIIILAAVFSYPLLKRKFERV
ncbi:MAG: DMT family transporter [Bacteroidetes bacterium]|nr:DMT family transporter [Bacteroidota bacterium]